MAALMMIPFRCLTHSASSIDAKYGKIPFFLFNWSLFHSRCCNCTWLVRVGLKNESMHWTLSIICVFLSLTMLKSHFSMLWPFPPPSYSQDWWELCFKYCIPLSLSIKFSFLGFFWDPVNTCLFFFLHWQLSSTRDHYFSSVQCH